MEVLGRLTGHRFEFRRIERVGRTGSRIWVRTDGLDRDLEIQRASQGTLSIVTIFGLIQTFLGELASFRHVAPSRDIDAVVLIDEIDAHLHPAWQQKIRNMLTDIFPNVQFLLSAHSPLIVAGCGPGEVAVLRRHGVGFGVEQLDADFVGASASDLYRDIFDIEDLDEVFLEYAAKKAAGEEVGIERRLDMLFAKDDDGELTASERDELDDLVLDARRIDRVSEIQQRRANAEQCAVQHEAEIARLRSALRKITRGTDPL